MDENRIYTVKEVARLLGFSTNTIYKYLDEGKIKSTRLGEEGRFRIPQKEVAKLLGLKGAKPQIASDLVGGKIKLPYSLRPQAHEIIRTWTFYTIVKSYFSDKEIPWNNVMLSGFIKLEGEKMSKSKKNFPLKK